MRDTIERLRAKPEHVRKQIALGISSGVTGVVALGWIAAVVATGPFTLSAPTSETLANAGTPIESSRTAFSELLGAVGAATATSSEPELVIVETHSSSTVDPEPTVDNRTVIPF